jgi:UDP-N-acetyl-D-glucosamine/UDP-N-acetyl-D-galactosamine dehydrogenase
MISTSKIKIAIIGLGYVGLPLARLFATQYTVVGFDINTKRIQDLKLGIDTTQEIDTVVLKDVLITENELSSRKPGLFVTNEKHLIADCNFYIITVPTPVDKNNRPDMSALFKASETVGNYLKPNDIVVYESTVYPGATEEECVPILEKTSRLLLNKDFFVGYSPERINPGDKEHTVDKILKITSGSDFDSAQIINSVYKSVITAGTYLAPSIKVAEAAKVIENSQRDINIAFVNELSKIFNLMEIDTHEVLQAAATKWNFLPFKPGLVGGHCIGVDPYYLAQKAQELGYHPEIILAGRRLNDSMSEYVATQIVKLMIKKDIAVSQSELLLLGITFKENCPDFRNTKIVNLIRSLEDYGILITVFDPLVDTESVMKEYGVKVTNQIPNHQFDAIVMGVSHHVFQDLDLLNFKKAKSVVYDIKGVLNTFDNRL